MTWLTSFKLYFSVEANKLLINVYDILQKQKDVHVRSPEIRSQFIGICNLFEKTRPCIFHSSKSQYDKWLVPEMFKDSGLNQNTS